MKNPLIYQIIDKYAEFIKPPWLIGKASASNRGVHMLYLYRVQRDVVGSPSSNLVSAPHWGSAHWADSYEDMEMGLSECLWITALWMYILYKRKINSKRVAYGNQTFNI